MAPQHGVNIAEMASFHSHHAERVVNSDFFFSNHLGMGQKGVWGEKLALLRQLEINSGRTGIPLMVGGIRFEGSVFSLESHNFFLSWVKFISQFQFAGIGRG
jgi:hypothetical protein